MTLRNLLEPFDKYFLYLMIVHCLILIFIDTREFNKNNNKSNAQKSRTLGYSFLGLSIMMFLLKIFLK